MSEEPQARSVRVLVVDDERSIRVTMDALLQAAGYAVDTAEDVPRAQKLLAENDYDVVVCDVVLPGVSGVALLQLIKHMSPIVQVVMMSGEPTVDAAAEAIRAGASDYLVKPVGKNATLRSVGNAARVKHADDDRIRLEEANAAYRQELEGMVTSLKQEVERRTRAEEATNDFLSMASHDLRTPLAISKEAIGLLTDDISGSLAPEHKDFLDIARRNLDRLSNLVDNLLDVSLLDANKLTIEKENVELVALVRQVCTMLQPGAARRGLTLEVDAASEEIEMLADPGRMFQILANLGGNAVKYTDAGSVKFRVWKEDKHVIVEVSDTGAGIPSDELAVIFARFHRAKGSLTKRKGGIGLGLFITQRLVELHDGTISVQSEEGKGSVFTVRLPCHV